MKRKQLMSFKSFVPALGSWEALGPWLESLAEEVAERLREDASRRPRSLVVHHRGELEEGHAKHWMAGRTSALTKTVSRTCAFPTAPSAAAIAAASRRVLSERLERVFPCSRLAIGATDFEELPQGPQITAFFGRASSSKAAVPSAALPARREIEELEAEQHMRGGGVAQVVKAPGAPQKPSSGSSDVQVASFHRASRLHFLGTWRERFEQWRKSADQGGVCPGIVSQLRRDLKSASSAPGFAAPSAEYWAHLDMDCFFASVATRGLPEGDAMPTAVTSGVGSTSEICSANYVARAHGVTTALWTVQRAMEVLPTLRIIPVSEELLRAVEAAWQQVYQLLLVACDGEAGRVLMRSCDEASLRVPRCMEALSWARAIRAAVRSQTGCSCSVGFGPSQVVAKLAVKVCKPDGVKAVVGADDVRDFLAEVPTSSLPQVGRQLAAKLKEHGLERCCDVARCSRAQMRQWFGQRGEMVWANAQGQDQEVAAQQMERKTMSAEINWGVRLQDRTAALKLLAEVAAQLAERLSTGDHCAAHLTLKLKIAVPGWVEPPWKKGGHGICDDVSRSSALPRPTSERAALLAMGAQLYDSVSPEAPRIRGLGLAARLSDGRGALERWFAPRHERRPESGDSARAVEVESSGSSGEALDVACPVCGALRPQGDVERHVNRHFEAEREPNRRSTSRPPDALPEKRRRTLLDFAAASAPKHRRPSAARGVKAEAVADDCEVLD